MFPWQDIGLLIVRGAIAIMFEPMFWMILGLVGFQYWQMQKSQIKMFGVYGYSLRWQIVLAAFYGLVGGIIGSFLLTFVGVTVNQLGLNYIWPVALVMAMINIRFICFAYAGGIIATANVLFGWPEVNVPQVLALVALLHVTESVLIFISSRYSAVPIILRREDGRLVGAFNLQNFWPLPLILLAAIAVPGQEMPSEVLKMPDWWPILPLVIEAPADHHWIYAMVPVVAALGYADMAVSSPPAVRRRQSALHLAMYSIVLLTLAILSAKYTWLQLIAALLSPLGHELLIQLDNRRELGGQPIFVPAEYGVKVLDTIPNSPARKLNLKPGDILISLAGMPINNGYDFAQAISFAPEEFTLEFFRNGRTIRQNGRFLRGERRMGVIVVPEGHEQHYVMMVTDRYGLWDWLKRKLRRR